jgi:hypothetical protein
MDAKWIEAVMELLAQMILSSYQEGNENTSEK